MARTIFSTRDLGEGENIALAIKLPISRTKHAMYYFVRENI